MAALKAGRNSPAATRRVRFGAILAGGRSRPQPQGGRRGRRTGPAPPVLEFLVSFAAPQMRLVALVFGGMLLGAAVLFSIPTAEAKPARA